MWQKEKVGVLLGDTSPCRSAQNQSGFEKPAPLFLHLTFEHKSNG